MNSHKPTIVSTATVHGRAPCFIMVCVSYMIWSLETANPFPQFTVLWSLWSL